MILHRYGDPPVTDTEEIVKPTRQRLRLAKSPAVIIDGKVVVAANDNFVIDSETGAARMQDSPIDRLRRTGSITEGQHTAGKRYYADWYAAGLAPLGAFDYTRPIVDGASPKGDSDYRSSASFRWNAARKAMGGFLAAVVDPVVLSEQPVESAGRAVSGRADRREARAVAMDRLLGGLDVLCKSYGIAK